MAGDNPDLNKQLSVRSSGRDRNAVDYTRLASGTQGEPTQFDPSQPTINKQSTIKNQKSGISVNQKHLRKSQDLIKNIKSSQQWQAVAQAINGSDAKETYEKELEFIDTIA